MKAVTAQNMLGMYGIELAYAGVHLAFIQSGIRGRLNKMENHILKTDPDPFSASLEGIKGFELRFNDRDFRPGDTLTLQETKYSYKEMINIEDPKPLEYTGREIENLEINYVLHGNNYGLLPGWVILSL